MCGKPTNGYGVNYGLEFDVAVLNSQHEKQ